MISVPDLGMMELTVASVMSAVALRRLRQQQKGSEQSEPAPTAETPAETKELFKSGAFTASDMKKAQAMDHKSPAKPLSKAKSPTAAAVAAQTAPPASTYAPAPQLPVRNLKKSRPAQFSTWKPNKTNHRRKKDGSVEIDIPEGEVSMFVPFRQALTNVGCPAARDTWELRHSGPSRSRHCRRRHLEAF